MKKAISIPELLAGEKPTESKGIEFTHYLNSIDGEWENALDKPQEYDKIAHIGKKDGIDFFIAYFSNSFLIYKGHLNNGTY